MSEFMEKNSLQILSEVAAELPFSDNSDPFPEEAFAKLEGQNIHYFIKSLKLIVGGPKSSVADIRIPATNISDKYAMIFYNFERDLFQIQCIARDGAIRINGIAYGFFDPPRDLTAGCIIQINEAIFQFILSPNSRKFKRNWTSSNSFHFNSGYSSKNIKEKRKKDPKNEETPANSMQSAKIRAPLRDRTRPRLVALGNLLPDEGEAVSALMKSQKRKRQTSLPYTPPENSQQTTRSLTPQNTSTNNRHALATKHLPFDPLFTEKPIFSTEYMILEAFSSMYGKAMNVDDITGFIAQKYTYFQSHERQMKLKLAIKLCLSKRRDRFIRISRMSGGKKETLYALVELSNNNLSVSQLASRYSPAIMSSFENSTLQHGLSASMVEPKGISAPINDLKKMKSAIAAIDNSVDDESSLSPWSTESFRTLGLYLPSILQPDRMTPFGRAASSIEAIPPNSAMYQQFLTPLEAG